jgi:chorismate-pyruvate lyase
VTSAQAEKAPLTHREKVAARLNLPSLSPVLRTLLTTDGTVTEVLAAHFGEEVGVRVVTQGVHRAEGHRFPELQLEPGTQVLDRAIVLTGKRSGRVYTAAGSRLVPGMLPGEMQEALLAGNEPLGKLMLTHRLETWREIVDCGRCLARHAPLLEGAVAPALRISPVAPVVWRTYRVYTGGQAAMSITEYFPEALA